MGFLAVAVSVTVAAPQDKKGGIGVKAPSPYENCNCQCHHYTWQDTYGAIQGNCKSSDGTRGRWRYVDSNSCDDLQYSKNRRDQYGQLRKWSYQACSTPAPGTGRCAYGGGYGSGYGSGSGCNERHGNCNSGYNNNGYNNGYNNNGYNNNGYNNNGYNNNNNYRPNRPGGILGGILGGVLNQPRKGDKSSSTKGGINFGQ